MISGGDKRILVLECRIGTGYGENFEKEPDKCDDLSWFPIDRGPSNAVSYVDTAIRLTLNGTSYSEFGWDAK